MADIALEIDTSQASEAIAGLQAQAETLLATLEKCRECTKECGITVDINSVLKDRGKDLVAILRTQDYRNARTS